MAKRRRKPKPKPKPKPKLRKSKRSPTARQIARAGERIIRQRELLRPLIREAAKAGAAEAIEHCGNFWNVSNGYKRYIDHQVETQAEALKATVREALRREFDLQEARRNDRTARRKRKP